MIGKHPAVSAPINSNKVDHITHKEIEVERVTLRVCDFVNLGGQDATL